MGIMQMLMSGGGPSFDDRVTGGNDTFTYSGKQIHVFTSSGALTVSGGPVSLEVFMVAGGGGGGGYCGGGGGAGGVVLHTDISCGDGDNAVVVGGQVGRRIQGEVYRNAWRGQQ